VLLYIYRSKAWRGLYWLAAVSGCERAQTETEAETEQASVAVDAESDAGDSGMFDVDRWLSERKAAYCDRKLDVVCNVEEPGKDYCDFDAWVAKTCAEDAEAKAHKNTCGGFSLNIAKSFGGFTRWHYNEAHELIGAHLFSDTTQYCDDHTLELGTQCEAIGKLVPVCVSSSDE
jgi:hypothetical protein